MGEPLTVDELLPLVARLSPKERVRLFRLVGAAAGDADTCQAAPPTAEEFASDEDALAWDAEGWENVG